MKPAAFEYHRPTDLAQVLRCLAELDDVKLLAGGQSLMAMMNFRYVTPAHLVDLNRIPELAGIGLDGDELVIGAMTRQRDIKDSALVRERCPLLVEALHWVGHLQTRNRGTIGGSLAHLDPSAELPGVLLACDARMEVHGPAGEREIAIHEWAVAYMTPALDPDELLVRVRVPLWPAGHGHGFHELARRHGDFAVAGAAALVSLDGDDVARAAVALIGVDDAPLRLAAAEALLVGNPADDARLAAAADLAHEVPGIDDVHAGAEYRRRIAVVMTRRALSDAVTRARGRYGRSS
jgi:carbon-monoxide dehydrogenase medium subunit